MAVNSDEIRRDILDWFESDFKESAKSTTRTSRLDDKRVSYSFSVVNNSGYDFDRFSYNLKVVNKADGSSLGSATINVGQWNKGEKKNFKSTINIPAGIKSVSFVMAANSVDYEVGVRLDGESREFVEGTIRDLRDLRDLEDMITGADGSGGIFGELFGTGGMPETNPAPNGNGGNRKSSGTSAGSIGSGPATGSRSGEINAGPQSSQRQRSQRRPRQAQQTRTQPRQEYTTPVQSYSKRKNEKKLNKKRLGKSSGAMVSAIFAVMTGIAALAESNTPEQTYTYLGLAALLGLAAIVVKTVNTRRAKRIRAYEAKVNVNGNTSLDDLAEQMNCTVSKVIDDIQKMLADGFFAGAYIDVENRLLVMTRNGVPIQDPEKSATAVKKARRQAAREKGKLPESIEDLIIMTDDNEIKTKLKTLRTITKKIDQRVEEAPELADQVTDFREKYYPEVVRLTDEYNEKIADLGKIGAAMPAADPEKPEINLDPNNLERQANDIKKQLVSLIDSVTEASENLLEKLHEGELMDISTDIQMLQTTLASKGLLDSDFDL
ncbi:MAG: hypothetical protein IJH95_02395 [Mogibacterium sp.]|nr:hypothetical protein [Mogibacterium sp.]